MKQRWVAIPIDAMCAIFADYAGKIGFPPDAKPVRLLMHPASGKLMLEVEAESLAKDEPPEEIRFSLKRTHLVN